MREIKHPERFVIAANQKVKEKGYWLKKLSGSFVKSSFPYDLERTTQEPEMASMEIHFPNEICSKLMKLSRNSNHALYVFLQASLVLFLHKYCGSDDIVTGSTIHKQKIEGDLINAVLVLRNQLSDYMTFKDLLFQAKQTIMEALENRNYPIEILLEQLDLPVEKNEFPLFDIAVLLGNIHDRDYIRHLNLKMIFIFFRDEKRIEGVVEYNQLLFRKNTILKIIERFSNLISRLPEAAEEKLSDIEILTDAEKHEMLYDFNNTRTEYPREKTTVELFEQQVEQSPGSIAVVFGKKSLSYRKLNEKANQLARLLREKGVRSGSIVGIILERSEEMIIVILGILKAGGTYLPIDANFPQERMKLMLDDCRVSLLLANTDITDKFSFKNFQDLDNGQIDIHKTGSRPRILNFDSPIIDRSLIDYNRYNLYIGQGMVKNSITLQATRGCPYNCAYCCRVWTRKYVVRSAENIFSEIKLYYDMGVRRFVFIDDIFNLDVENSTKFFELIIKHNMKIQMLFPSGLRGDILTENYIDLMVEAGVISFPLAVETASPRLQKLISKNIDIDRLGNNLHYITQKYPHVILELHTMHGFPTETEEEALMTLDFIKRFQYIHFPYIHILTIYSNTDMMKLALESGITKDAISRSEELAYHELPETLPFSKGFTLKYQTKFLNEYFLLKKRLLKVLPYQMDVLTEDEIVQKYNSYLPVEVKNFPGLIDFLNISEQELGNKSCLSEDKVAIYDLNEKLQNHFSKSEPAKDALRVLLLDLSQLFSGFGEQLYDVVEQPIGVMYILSYLNREFGDKLNGRIAKSRIDFDNYNDLGILLRDFKPDVIGIRTLSCYKDFFHNTIAVIRGWGIDVPIIAGGPYATTEYEDILLDRNVDVVVLGEGEVTFSELVREIVKNDKRLPGTEILAEIPGIVFPAAGERRDRPGREIVLLDQVNQRLPGFASGNLPTVCDSNGVVYIMYTSGSTGKPKGTLTSHYNVTRMVKDTNYVEIGAADRMLQLSNYAFDGSVFDIYGALLNGAALVMVNRDRVIVVDQLSDLIKSEAITVFFVTTALFNTLVDLRIECFDRVRKVLFGGERVSLEHTRKALEYMGSGRVIHVYGPTETTVYATYYFIDHLDGETRTVPIGKPIANTSVYILDRNLHSVPAGISGEIYIGGDGLAYGYLNKPELTKEKFVGNPYPSSLRGRDSSISPHLYRTGDLALWSAGGEIEFLGRIDQQVKIRGFRIEPGEIDKQLLGIEGVESCVVIDRARGNEKYLCAYVVSGRQIAAAEIRSILSESLPEYMIPAYFVQVERIPLTPNGKVDRRALPEPEIEAGPGYIAPRDELEKRLVELWSEILMVEAGKIGIESDFFELGGHSLRATILISRLHKEFGVKVSLVKMFVDPTIRGLSILIKKGTRLEYSALQSMEKKEYYPLSSAQKRLYILQQMEFNNTSYNIPFRMELGTGVDIARLEEAFRSLIARHESLRSSFEMINGEPVQRVYLAVAFEVEHYDFAGENLDTDEIQRKVRDMIENFARPFDLSKAPLLRVGVIRGGISGLVLLYDLHHIITDGTSQAVLEREFYSLVRGEDLPPLRLHYKDFACWQKRQLEQELQQQETFWLNLFCDEVPVLNLPTDFARPLIQSFEGASVGVVLNERESSVVKGFAGESDATLFMVMLALYNILLSKLSGQENIVVGTPIAARRHADLEKIIGMFVNTLALRNRSVGEATFKEFLDEIKQNTVAAYENQEYQFEELVEKLDVKRDAGRNPFFDVMLNLLNQDEYGREFSEEEERGHEHNVSQAKFDLTITVVDFGRNIYLDFNYCTKLFKPGTIDEFINCFRRIINQLTVDKDQKLSDIEILAEEKKQKILVEFNDTGQEYPKDKMLHELFEEQAARIQDTISIVSGEFFLSYRELDKRANRLSHYLEQKSVKPDSIVGIMVERSSAMMVGILGILKAGGAYLPIDPGYPEQRIKYMLVDSRAKLLITSLRLFEEIEKLRNLEVDSIYIEEVEDDFSGNFSNTFQGHNFSTSQLPNFSEALAYVIYTSGSTGNPKGVAIKQQNVINFIKAMTDRIDFLPGNAILAVTTICFDIFFLETLLPIVKGLKVIIADEMQQKDAGLLADLIADNGINMVQMTPSQLKLLLLADEELNSLDGVRQLMIGGEAFPGNLFDTVKEQFKGKIYNMYGPTETTIWSAVKNLTGVGKVNIGTPVANNRVYIVDKNYGIQPIGAAGELCIGGDGVGRGYLNRPELTEEKFVMFPPRCSRQLTDSSTPQPTNSSPPQLIYHTGDLARWLPDGEIEVLGRMDYQVKIRGFRIELEEIEERLLEHEGIKEAVVIARSDRNGDDYLCAYFVEETPGLPTEPDPGAVVQNSAPSGTELREYLAQTMPSYMEPSYFVQIEEMPLTSNGKLDRRALPEPVIEVGSGYIAPRDKTEQRLVEIWSEILGVNAAAIGINSDFFKLGGHSLWATVLLSRVHKEFGVRINLGEMFVHSTVQGLSTLIKEGTRREYSAVRAVETKEYYPLSSAQKRLYILQQMSVNSIGYNMNKVVELGERIEVVRLEGAFRKLIARHESLRTGFEMINGEPVQQVHLAVVFEVEHYDFAGENLDTDEIQRKVQDVIVNFARPFDLSKAPLLRVGVIESGISRPVLLFDLHHIITDGLSQRILVQEFFSLYSDEKLPLLRIHYKDFACWQKRQLEQELQQQETFWLNLFCDEVPVLNLPTDFPRPLLQGYEGASVGVVLNEKESNEVKRLAGESETTLFMVFLSLYNILLSKLSSQEDIVIGAPIAGRRHTDIEDIIGMFVNTLALRNRPCGEKTFKEFLNEVKHSTLAAYENQEYQFEELVEKVEVNRDTSRNPLFDVMLDLLNQEEYGREFSKEEETGYRHRVRQTKFDLTLTVVDYGRNIFLNFNYSTKLFNPVTIEKCIGYFRNLIRLLLHEPEQEISEIDILTDAEKQEILYEFNDIRADYPMQQAIHELFEAQVYKTPGNRVVIHNDRVLTYGELNDRANHLAGVLRKKDVKRDTIVGIMAERSIEMIIGVFAVLKAGCAYLPIDITYPENRKKYLLKDSSAKLLLIDDSIGNDVLDHPGVEVIKIRMNETFRKNCEPILNINQAGDHVYILYTSGTTGRPKGVMVRHRNVLAYLYAFYNEFEINSSDVVLQQASYTFDVFVEETFPILLKGGAAAIINRIDLIDMNFFVGYVRKNKVSIIDCSPLLLNELNLYADSLSNIRLFISGGDILKKSYINNLNKIGEVYNTYGPTETTVCAAYFKYMELPYDTIPIGKSIANYSLYVVGKNHKLMSMKVPGELWISGPGLTSGYLNQIELTCEKIIPNPFTLEGYVYKTGDLARWQPDGNIEFLGRIDHQVKIRGYRIEIGEIENQLLKLDAVKECVVIDREKEGDKYLCAYIVSGKEVDVPEVRNKLSKILPGYMIPSYIMQVDSIPLTPNGKIDRRALPVPEIDITGEYIAPENEVETKLVEIWSEVLGIEKEKISITANFFRLGGHSLKAIILIEKLHKELNVRVSLDAIFRFPTIREIAVIVSANILKDKPEIDEEYEEIIV